MRMRSGDLSPRGDVAFLVLHGRDGHDVADGVADERDRKAGNGDVEEVDLTAAVRAYIAGTDGRVALVDDDTLVLVPARKPTKAEATVIERAFAALSFDDESTPVVVRRVLAEARAGRSSFFWWD